MADYATDNEVIDRIIRTRRSVRQFKEDIPPKALLEQIIEAGRLAPFAGLANVGATDFRHFFVFRQGSPKIEQLKSIMQESVAVKLAHYENETNPRAQTMLKVMRSVAENGFPFSRIPWMIIVAERRGFPPREDKSLAHVLQNMWLKAVALDLGFQLVSAVTDAGENEKLSELLGVPHEKYAYDACIIGYPEKSLTSQGRDIPHMSIKWFE